MTDPTAAAYAEFYDITGASFDQAPLVAGQCVAVYLTGSGGVPETSPEIAAAIGKGMGLIGIDQTPSLATFGAGATVLGVKCVAADVEPYAGTDSAAHVTVPQRQARGEESLLYVSQSNWAQLKADIADSTGVWYWIANWSYSLAEAQAFMDANPDVACVQFGDPASNPNTLIPGTAVTLSMCDADIDVARASFLAQFLGTPVPPAPTPPPVKAPPFPFPAGHYLGTPRPDPMCHSGYYSSVDNHVVALFQQRMKDRGWDISPDGYYGENRMPVNQGQTPSVVHAFQTQKDLPADDLVGPVTWAAAWELPVTPG